MFAAICCFSKFCVLKLIPDRTSSTIATAIREHIIAPFGVPSTIRTDNGLEFSGATTTLLSSLNVTHHRTAPYTSHSNGQVERLHRTVQALLRRTLITLPHTAWTRLIPDLQLIINTTYARSIGCSPYLIMFGATPPSPGSIPDPSTTSISSYARAIQRQVRTISRAARAAHSAYSRRTNISLPPDPITTSLTPGRLAIIIRPRHNKLLTTNSGPYLVIKNEPPHIHL